MEVGITIRDIENLIRRNKKYLLEQNNFLDYIMQKRIELLNKGFKDLDEELINTIDITEENINSLNEFLKYYEQIVFKMKLL